MITVTTHSVSYLFLSVYSHLLSQLQSLSRPDHRLTRLALEISCFVVALSMHCKYTIIGTINETNNSVSYLFRSTNIVYTVSLAHIDVVVLFCVVLIVSSVICQVNSLPIIKLSHLFLRRSLQEQPFKEEGYSYLVNALLSLVQHLYRHLRDVVLLCFSLMDIQYILFHSASFSLRLVLASLLQP